MGDGSPIHVGATAQTIATFNKPVEKADLLDKLVAVMWIDDTPYTMTAYAAVQQADRPTLIRLANGNDSTAEGYVQADLLINGANLIAQNADTEVDEWLFTIDFDRQHQKSLDNDGKYYIVNPLLSEKVDNYQAYLVCDIDHGDITIYAEEREGSPFLYLPSDDEIDLGAWFNGESYVEGIETLIEKILSLEYHFLGNISWETEIQPFEVSPLNLLTDGSPFVPLVMTSRFPNGCPVRDSNMDGAVAMFNRKPDLSELAAGLSAVIGKGSNYSNIATISFYASGGELIGEGSAGSGVYLHIESSTGMLVTSYAGVNFKVFDIDFDYQHQRTLDVVNVGNYYVSDINLLGTTDKLCLQFGEDTDAGGGIGINIACDGDQDPTPLVRTEQGEYVFDQQLHANDYKDIVQAIAGMEFGFSGTVDTQEVEAEWAEGPFALLTDSDVDTPEKTLTPNFTLPESNAAMLIGKQIAFSGYDFLHELVNHLTLTVAQNGTQTKLTLKLMGGQFVLVPPSGTFEDRFYALTVGNNVMNIAAGADVGLSSYAAITLEVE